MKNCGSITKCCSSQTITDRNLKLGRIVENASKCWKSYFLMISEVNPHSRKLKNLQNVNVNKNLEKR